MAIRTAKEYIESIRGDDRVVYYRGEKVEDVTTHPALQRLLKEMALDYLVTEDPQYSDLFIDTNEKGEKVRFLHKSEQSVDDLLRRRKIIQLMARMGYGIPGGSNTTGVDAMNAVSVVCDRMDRKTGTKPLATWAGRLSRTKDGASITTTNPMRPRCFPARATSTPCTWRATETGTIAGK